MKPTPNLFVFSGAGLSAASGIPTFRDENGLWHNHKIDQICDYTTWKQNAQLVHEFYNQRRQDLSTVSANAAHYMIADWQRRYPGSVTVITQNVDNLLEAAGCDRVVHVHGLLTRMHCTACAHVWDVGYHAWDPHEDRCPKCSSRKGVKPGVVFFNERAPEYAHLYQAIQLLNDASTVVVIGTTSIVVDIQSLLHQTPGVKILNNLEPVRSLDEQYWDHVFYESAHTACDKIDYLVKSRMEGCC